MNLNCLYILNQIHHISDIQPQETKIPFTHNMVIQIIDEPYSSHLKLFSRT